MSPKHTHRNHPQTAAAQRLQSALVNLVARPESRQPDRRQQHTSQVTQLLQAYRELMKTQAVQ
ncbi:MAG: hypothetical protein KIT46_02850 [Anaerolineales bacterium]|nr:hypothetical protein [Anaerolineales bacterium]MCW5854964.1 hypothetical protein [Anaerolineales bacterium]